MVSPSGQYLAVAHSDNIIRFYHADNYNKLGQHIVGFTVNIIRYSNDGLYLAVGGVSTTVKIINGYEPFLTNIR